LYPKRRAEVLETSTTYVEAVRGDAVVVLHGNPAPHYLWRNVIPHLEGTGRCLAPHLLGIGDSPTSRWATQTVTASPPMPVTSMRCWMASVSAATSRSCCVTGAQPKYCCTRTGWLTAWSIGKGDSMRVAFENWAMYLDGSQSILASAKC
jgi:hypothetical protein